MNMKKILGYTMLLSLPVAAGVVAVYEKSFRNFLIAAFIVTMIFLFVKTAIDLIFSEE